MSGALWFFFWDDTVWGGAPPPPTPAPTRTPDPDSGGGRKRKKSDYVRADDTFWALREAYLRSIHAETLPELPPAPRPASLPPAPPPTPTYFTYQFLPRYNAERQTAIERLRVAETIEELKAAGARLIELNYAIQRARAEESNYRRALRKLNRQKLIRRAERKLAILRASELLLKLLTTHKA